MNPIAIVIWSAIHASPHVPAPQAPPEILHVAAQIGITPATLAAGGFSGSAAVDVLQRLSDAATQRESLHQAWALAKERGNSLKTARAALSLQPQNEQRREAVTSASQAFREATDLVRTRQEALRQIALDGCDQLAVARARASLRPSVLGLSAPMRTSTWSSASLDRLQHAVRVSKRAARRQQPVPPEIAAVLAEANSTEEVTLVGQLIALRTAELELVFRFPQP